MAKIDISDMPSNSNAAKKIEPPSKNNKPKARAVKRTKKRRLAKLGDAFLNVDDAPRIDIVHNVFEPGIKNLALDIISSIADTIVDAFQLALFKDARPRNRSVRRDDDRYRNGYIDYSSRSSSRRGSEDRRRTRRSGFSRDVGDFYDLTFRTFADAQKALRKAKDILDGQDYVSIADMYHAADLEVRSSLDSQWGWTNLKSAVACRANEYEDPDYPYILVLPEPKDITEYIRR